VKPPFPRLSDIAPDSLPTRPEEPKEETPLSTLNGLLRDRTHYPVGWEPPVVEWILPGMIPDGYSIVAGRPKTGKSFLLLDVALAVANGGHALGKIPVEQGDVLYMALEDPEGRVVRRARHVLGTDILPEGFHFLSRAAVPYLRGGGMVSEFLRSFKERGCPGLRLVVIDTMAMVRPPRGRQGDIAKEDYDLGARVAGLSRELGTAIIGVFHAAQSETADPLDQIAGTYGVTAAADGTCLLRRDRDTSEGVLMGTSREGADYQVAMRSENGRWRIVDQIPRAGNAGLGRRSREVLAVLMEAGPMSAAEVALRIGVESARAQAVLGRLREFGLVGCPARDVWAVVPE